jgi:hypothetical protein
MPKGPNAARQHDRNRHLRRLRRIVKVIRSFEPPQISGLAVRIAISSVVYAVSEFLLSRCKVMVEYGRPADAEVVGHLR